MSSYEGGCGFEVVLTRMELIPVEDILEMGLELTLQKEKQLLPM